MAGRKRCRLHGGLSPGAPRGSRNGNYRRGDWTKAIEERRWLRSQTPSSSSLNGGQAKAEATLPEVRLAVAEPDLDVGNVETVLEALSTTCYYLSAEKNRSGFSLSPNLNKLLADRRASVQTPRVEERIRAEVKKVFAEEKGVIDRNASRTRAVRLPGLGSVCRPI